jgi:hypothetical protein
MKRGLQRSPAALGRRAVWEKRPTRARTATRLTLYWRNRGSLLPGRRISMRQNSAFQTQKHSQIAAQRERQTSSGESVGCICDRGGRFILRRRRACCVRCEPASRHGCMLKLPESHSPPFRVLRSSPRDLFFSAEPSLCDRCSRLPIIWMMRQSLRDWMPIPSAVTIAAAGRRWCAFEIHFGHSDRIGAVLNRAPPASPAFRRAIGRLSPRIDDQRLVGRSRHFQSTLRLLALRKSVSTSSSASWSASSPCAR